MLKVSLAHDNAKLPRRSHPTDAGLDIFAVGHATLRPGVHAVLPTGLHIEIPDGYVGLIWPRSGLAAKYGIDTLAGVVDSSYRGEAKVSIINHGHDEFEIKPGDRIAQLLIQPVMLLDAVQVDELTESERGGNGFGSTGR